MSKRRPRARYVLPAVVAPEGTRCFQILVPDDQLHIAAFKGQILALSSAKAWQNDDAHTALDLAEVWKTAYDTLTEECGGMFDVRIDPDRNCWLQKSTDGGETWEDVGSFQDCAQDAARDVIGGYIDDGILGPGAQQPGAGEGTDEQCYTYTVVIRGNDRWKCPIALDSDDTVQVIDSRGGWWDGDILNPWHCPDGKPYALGECADTGSGTESGDPAPTVDHMRLIGNLPGAAIEFFDMYNRLYTVPPATDLSEFYLQANDSVLDDNQGSITVVIEVCKHTVAGSWVHTWHAADMSEWTFIVGHADSTDGMVADDVGGGVTLLVAVHDASRSYHLTYSRVRYSNSNGTTTDWDTLLRTVNYHPGGSGDVVTLLADYGGGPESRLDRDVFTPDYPNTGYPSTNSIGVIARISGVVGDTAQIMEIELRGNEGTDPFA